MSTTAISYQSTSSRDIPYAFGIPSVEVGENPLQYSSSGGRFDTVSLSFKPAVRAWPKKAEKEQSQVRTIRRLQGFLVELDRADARVAFVQDGETIYYDMPAERFRRAGIEVRNQPFEMDEVEIEDENGLIIGYRLKALAKPSDAYIQTLDFDEERRRKRDLILKKFSKNPS